MAINSFIALSMRETHETRYTELRDAIARSWMSYLNATFPDLGIFLVPNDPSRAADYLRSLPLSGLILSGGNDIGESKDRDETEFRLFEEAIKLDVPVLGICRGAQLIQKALGGNVAHLEESSHLHIATEHQVQLEFDPVTKEPLGESMKVNSYHSQGIKLSQLSMDLTSFALSELDSTPSVEGFVSRSKKILGMMWHPERPSPNHAWNQRTLRKWFSQ